MHACIYVLITGPDTQTEELVAQALNPFDMNFAVPPYKLHLSHSGVRAMADHYGLPEADLDALAGKLPDWMNCCGDVDELGLYALITHNPDGKFDWYQIGGRWDGKITDGRRTRHNVFVRNSLAASALLSVRDFDKRLPHGIVTPTGEWVERMEYVTVSNGWYTRELTVDEWRDHVRRILAAFPAHRVVCVDVHF